MRRLVSLLVLPLAIAGAPLTFRVAAGDSGSWPQILDAAGFRQDAAGSPGILVVREGAAAPQGGWLEDVRAGGFVILEGRTDAAARLGFRFGPETVRVQSIRDTRRPGLPIIWQEALHLPLAGVPPGAQVFAFERWRGAPVMAGFREGAGAVLWVAAPPGRNGYERFPYLLHALAGLGLEMPFRSRRLWAFFDSSYRARADLDYLARRWRAAGIAALHVAAWHFLDAPKDAYLEELIRSCHRRGILVYAWLELPHVSETFWRDHPEWREKTALLQDAHLDWRKLMNLANPECSRAAADLVTGLLDRFDWDGVNLAELYFESLEGIANPARFTPMNADVRREFRQSGGFDPLELFAPDSPRHNARNAVGSRAFLNFRAGLARRIEVEWIGRLEAVRRSKPHLDLVLTHVDDRFDTGMRDAIGADAAQVLPLLESHDFTLLIEDPATVWHLGPQRYPEIARRYRALTRQTGKLGMDINVVERYQDVYPTRQQTGTELFQLVHQAAQSFSRVALYFENSILPPDLPLLPAAAATVRHAGRTGDGVTVDSQYGVGVLWPGAALVDGRPWPAVDGATVWLPPGRHVISPAQTAPAVRLLDFNGGLLMAAATADGLELAYRSSSRALAILDRAPVRIEIDGAAAAMRLAGAGGPPFTLCLPHGQHLVTVRTE
jgi:hypothetical protein